MAGAVQEEEIYPAGDSGPQNCAPGGGPADNITGEGARWGALGDSWAQGAALTIEGFTEIFEMYYSKMFRYIFYKVGDYHASEDLCSMAFERAIANYAAYDPQRASVAVWLFAIARNAVADYHRDRKRHKLIPIEAVGDMASPGGPEESCIDLEKRRELRRALATLRKKERDIIALKYGAGLKNTEIAAITGRSASGVGVALSRSMKKLERFLSKGGYRNE
ncbi:MAG: sigma-70 family RNA polymerase sigma factor [Clostridiales Family XIII bacterium]|jgi:RNA polymerase sigma-70 factor (ECF subfamily)|nr:sigma-70 family RNA polymerase sigma factor [Clostridiales Family XIII bacterium]